MEFWKRYKKQFSPPQSNFIGHLQIPNSRELTQEDSKKEDIMFSTFFTGSHLRDGSSFDSSWKDRIEEHVDQLKDDDRPS